MSCRNKEGPTWSGLIRAALAEDAARTVLSQAQCQALLARLKKEKMIPKR